MMKGQWTDLKPFNEAKRPFRYGKMAEFNRQPKDCNFATSMILLVIAAIIAGCTWLVVVLAYGIMG